MKNVRRLMNEKFLTMTEHYNYMSQWIDIYDKYAKLLEEENLNPSNKSKIIESKNDRVDLTNKDVEIKEKLIEFCSKLKLSRTMNETTGLSEAHFARYHCFSDLKMNIRSNKSSGTKECRQAVKDLISQTANYVISKITTRADMSASIAGYLTILNKDTNSDKIVLLNLKGRMEELEKANAYYRELESKRGIAKEQKGKSASMIYQECYVLLKQLINLVNSVFYYYDNELFQDFVNELNGISSNYQLIINKRKAEKKRRDMKKGEDDVAAPVIMEEEEDVIPVATLEKEDGMEGMCQNKK